ncbi:MAG TPA: hypothetical protein EYM84_02190, partial [Flavobacteriales bacterium]|nr:hypothetical protein [Flavobacteriales bacterium]
SPLIKMILLSPFITSGRKGWIIIGSFSVNKICESIKGTLMHMDLFFVGIDVIGKYLTEINVTCPTGVRQIKNLGGPDIAKIFWDKLENST